MFDQAPTEEYIEKLGQSPLCKKISDSYGSPRIHGRAYGLFLSSFRGPSPLGISRVRKSGCDLLIEAP